MSDLFGNPDRMESGSAPAIAVDLFTATAERLAFESSFSLKCDACGTVDGECFCHGATATRIPNENARALSQERTELTQGCEDCGRVNAAPSHWNDGLFSSRLCETKRQTCGRCGVTFIAKPRADSTCNLCRHKPPKRHETRIVTGRSVSNRDNLRAACSCGWEGVQTFQRWRAEREAKAHSC